MSMIKATAYPNNLTKGEDDDYYLLADVIESLTLDDIVERLRKKEIATKNVDGKTFTQNVFDECGVALSEGYNVTTSLFIANLGLQGAVKAADLGHPIPNDRVSAKFNFNPGATARKQASAITVFAKEQSAAAGPVIQSICDPTQNVSNTLTVGGMVLLKGLRVTLKGDDPSVGITFKKEPEDDRPVIESLEDEIMVKPTDIYPNTRTNLQFVLPAEVTAGKWRVSITTQGTASSKIMTKEPRSYQYDAIITVETRKM